MNAGRDGVDRLRDVADILNGFANHPRAVARQLAGAVGQAQCFIGAVGHMVDADGEFFHRGGHLRRSIALHIGRVGQLLGAVGNLAGGLRDFASAVLEGAQIGLQALQQAIERRAGLAHFVHAQDGGAAGEVEALGHFAGGVADAAHALADSALQRDGQP